MKKITLKEIALKFGVSISTVSKAINNSHEISEDLKKRIQEFTKEQNYRPNRIAISLSKQSTKTIGVIVPNILNYFFTQVFCGIERTANARGYHIVSCVSDESYLKELKTVELLGAGTVDGLIMSLSKETQKIGKINHLLNFSSNQIPLVLFDRVTEKIECDKVVVDDYHAGYRATKHLLHTGCKNIAMVSPIHGSSVEKLRLKGYREALREDTIAFDKKLIIKVKEEDDLELPMSFLMDYKRIDAIIALDEITAVKVLNIVKEKGIKVPEEISIIGFTNGRLSRYVTPSLTMVSQHGKFIGELAANILMDRIETKSLLPFTTELVETSLIERDSTISLK